MLIDKKRKQFIKKLVNKKIREKKTHTYTFHIDVNYANMADENLYVQSKHAISITRIVNWTDVAWEIHDKTEYMEKFPHFKFKKEEK